MNKSVTCLCTDILRALKLSIQSLIVKHTFRHLYCVTSSTSHQRLLVVIYWLELTVRPVANTSWCSLHQQTEDRKHLPSIIILKSCMKNWLRDTVWESCSENHWNQLFIKHSEKHDHMAPQDRVDCTQKGVSKGSHYLATLTIWGLYCLRSCNSVFIVFPVSMMSLKWSTREAHISNVGLESGRRY